MRGNASVEQNPAVHWNGSSQAALEGACRPLARAFHVCRRRPLAATAQLPLQQPRAREEMAQVPDCRHAQLGQLLMTSHATCQSQVSFVMGAAMTCVTHSRQRFTHVVLHLYPGTRWYHAKHSACYAGLLQLTNTMQEGMYAWLMWM